MVSRQNIWLKKKFDELKYKVFLGRCYNPFCKHLTDELEWAHIRPTPLQGVRGRGMSARYYDIINNLFSYTLLCKYCHEGYDQGWLEPDPVLFRDLATTAPLTLRDLMNNISRRNIQESPTT